MGFFSGHQRSLRGGGLRTPRLKKKAYLIFLTNGTME